jgi:hypothetical protein
VHADLLRYHPVANSWTSLAPSADQHYCSQAVYYNGMMLSLLDRRLRRQPTI